MFPQKLQYPLTIVLVHFIMKFVAAGSFRAGYTLYTGIDRVSLGKLIGRQSKQSVKLCYVFRLVPGVG